MEVFAPNVWEDGDPVAFLREQGTDFRLLLAADPVDEVWGVKGTPGLFVVDGTGTIRYRRGPSDGRKPGAAAAWWADQTREALAGLLRAGSSAPGQN